MFFCSALFYYFELVAWMCLVSIWLYFALFCASFCFTVFYYFLLSSISLDSALFLFTVVCVFRSISKRSALVLCFIQFDCFSIIFCPVSVCSALNCSVVFCFNVFCSILFHYFMSTLLLLSVVLYSALVCCLLFYWILSWFILCYSLLFCWNWVFLSH